MGLAWSRIKSKNFPLSAEDIIKEWCGYFKGGMVIDESSLVERARHRDSDALLVLYEQHYASVLTYLYYRLGDREQAEDLAAEVFVRMVENIATFRPNGRPILSWLYTIAHNLLVDEYRRRGKFSIQPLEENLAFEERSQPVHENERRQTCESISKALRQLTEDQRQVVILKFIHEYENDQVACFLGKNERAIRSLQHRALAALHRVLRKEFFDAP